MTFYTLILFLHVAAGLVLVGASLLTPLINRAIENTESVAALRSLLSLDQQAAAANPVAALVLLGSGIYLGTGGWFHAGWFYVSLALWVVNGVLAVVIVRRAAMRLAKSAIASGSGGAIPAEVAEMRRSRARTMAESVMAANDVAILYVMIGKPDVLQSCLVVIIANVMAAAIMRFTGTRAESLRPAIAEDHGK